MGPEVKTGLKVLIIDDDPDIHELLSAHLNQTITPPPSIQHAFHVADAQQLLTQGSPDITFFNEDLGDETGLTLLSTKLHFSLGTAVLMSGDTGSYRSFCSSHGVHFFMDKVTDLTEKGVQDIVNGILNTEQPTNHD